MSATTITETRQHAAQGIRAFYSRPIGWLALLVSSATLAYGGGGVMFWFHAIYRGEKGPPINDWYHWAFDSSLGFIALTPALFFILPGALWAIDRTRLGASRAKAAAYVALVGVLFGVVTGPGPIMHDFLVGRDTALGKLAVDVFGRDPDVAARVGGEYSTLSDVILQVAVGVPVYVTVALVALVAVRAMVSGLARA